jgi:hypothetical protein
MSTVTWEGLIASCDVEECTRWIAALRDQGRVKNLTRYGRAVYIRKFRARLRLILPV